MVLNTDDGYKAQCPKCRGVIKHGENVGVVDDGKNLWHSDCWRDRFGYESAKSAKQVREEACMRWANFDKQPPNPHGARKIA
jgi:hypothetical protein